MFISLPFFGRLLRHPSVTQACLRFESGGLRSGSSAQFGLGFVQHLSQAVEQIDLAEGAAFFTKQCARFEPVHHIEPHLFKLGRQSRKQRRLAAGGLAKG